MDESLPAHLVEQIDRKGFFFVQIGANDGIYYDPIRKWILDRGWPGIMFEPQTECFDQLQRLYEGNDQIRLVNKGIARESGTYRLYRHSSGSGCFSLLCRPNFCRPEDFLEVECLSMQAAQAEYGFKHADLLVIDTEGYDLEILDSIDLIKFKPRNIWFEKWTHANDDQLRPDYDTSIDSNQHVLRKYEQAGYRLEDYGVNLWLSL